MWRRSDENEEMRGSAVWLVRARHRNDTANVFDQPGSSGSWRVIRFASSAFHFSLVDKFPPWITKPFSTRLNVVVSSAPVADKLRKFLTASGAASGIIAISIAPGSVSSVTHWLASFSTGAPSK